MITNAYYPFISDEQKVIMICRKAVGLVFLTQVSFFVLLRIMTILCTRTKENIYEEGTSEQKNMSQQSFIRAKDTQ